MDFFAQLLLTKEETPQIQKTAKIKSHLTLLTPRLAFGYLGLVLSFLLSSHKNRTTKFFRKIVQPPQEQVFTNKTHSFRIAHPPYLELP
jgi:hypothetical protein